MIPLFIPFVNRPDLLAKAWASAACKGIERMVIDNSTGEKLRGYDDTLRPPVPLTFTQTQNWMLTQATAQWKSHFYLFMHSDAEAVGDSVLRLVSMANAYTIQKRKWGVIFTAYDALAAFNTAAFLEVGGWDTNLRWYGAEVDVYRRIRLAGYEIIDSGLPVKHTPSQTIDSDPFMKMCVNLESLFRNYYYQTKWGGPIGQEVFTVPFNGNFESQRSPSPLPAL